MIDYIIILIVIIFLFIGYNYTIKWIKDNKNNVTNLDKNIIIFMYLIVLVMSTIFAPVVIWEYIKNKRQERK